MSLHEANEKNTQINKTLVWKLIICALQFPSSTARKKTNFFNFFLNFFSSPPAYSLEKKYKLSVWIRFTWQQHSNWKKTFVFYLPPPLLCASRRKRSKKNHFLNTSSRNRTQRKCRNILKKSKDSFSKPFFHFFSQPNLM